MNSVLAKYGKEILPKMTDICHFSRNQINNKSIDAITSVIRGSVVNVNNLEFLGIRKLTPQESYESMLGSGNNMLVDITKSTFYKVMISFKTSEGDIISQVVALPYLDRYGLLTSSNVRYTIKPIITDNVLSAHASGIFVKLYITKTDISSIPLICRVNGNKENLSVIFSNINKRVVGSPQSILNKRVTPIVFYLLVKYGLLGTLKKVCGADVKIINKTDYVDDGKSIFYTHDELDFGILIKIKERLDVIDNIITSVFYILLGIKEKQKEFIEYIKDGNLSSEIVFWIISFGRYYYKGGLTVDKSTSSIMEHIEKVKSYLDIISKEDLKSIGIDVDDFTDLMLAILEQFNTTILNHKEISSDIKQNKKLNVLFYVLNKLTMNINSALLELGKREKIRGVLNKKEIEKILGDGLTVRLLHSIVKSTKKNLAVQLVSGCTDNTLQHLLISDDQNRGDGVYVNSNNTFPTSLRNITATHYLVGSMHNISKKAATPILRLSPFAKVNPNNQFIFDRELTLLGKECQMRMNDTLDNDYIGHEIDEVEDDLDDINY